MRPPQPTLLGRPVTELVQAYLENKKRCLCDQKQQKVCDTVHVSLISDLTLAEYAEALSVYCSQVHTHPCCKCEPLLQVANTILEESYCTLSKAFSVVHPGATYTAERARSVFLQMPLVSVRIGDPRKGHSFSLLMEKYPGTDYAKIGTIMNGLADTFAPKGSTLQKPMVKMLLSIAQSDHERECVRYALYKASGMSQTAVRRTYGFENMQARGESVEAAILEIQCIRQAIADLASLEDEALLTSLGVPILAESSSDESDEDEPLSPHDLESLSWSPDADHSVSLAEPAQQPTGIHPHQNVLGDEDIKLRLSQCDYNWFEFVEQLPVSTDAEILFNEISKLELSSQALQLIEQSHLAYLVAEEDGNCQDRIARIVNGEIVSESDSDDPGSYVGLTDPLSQAGKTLVAKKRASIQRRARRRQMKAVAEKRFLSRKISKKGSKILKQCPDIGKTIETYVQDRNVGADAWRRTGVLTFDGNTSLKQKATYEGIRQHLQQVYNRPFSYGTVVQLCIPGINDGCQQSDIKV